MLKVLKLRILHIAPAYKPAYIYGGPIYSVSALTEGMSALGNEVDVLTTTANGSAELDVEPGRVQEIEGVNVRYFKRVTGDYTHFTPSLIRYLDKNIRHYDIVHIHTWWNFVATLSARTCFRNGVQPIVSPRGMLSSYAFNNSNVGYKSMLHRVLGKKLLRKSMLHATVPNELAEFKAVIPEAQGFVLPNILVLPDEQVESSQGDDELFKLVFIGRVHQKKNLEAVIQALPALQFPYQLKIIGSGREEYIAELKALAERLGVAGHIEWKGSIVGTEKFKELAGSDLMILMSYSENFANTVIESLSVGLPVLLSEEVGMSDYVSRMKFGIAVKLDVADVAGSITELYHDNDWRNKIRATAPAATRHDFSPEVLIPKYIEQYEQVVEKKKTLVNH